MTSACILLCPDQHWYSTREQISGVAVAASLLANVELKMYCMLYVIRKFCPLLPVWATILASWWVLDLFWFNYVVSISIYVFSQADYSQIIYNNSAVYTLVSLLTILVLLWRHIDDVNRHSRVFVFGQILVRPEAIIALNILVQGCDVILSIDNSSKLERVLKKLKVSN